MGNGEVWDSRDEVVDCFLTRRSRGSLDGLVHTSGNILCVGPYHVAFWHQGMIYMVPLGEQADDLTKRIQAMVRLGTHGHRVVEREVENG